MDRAYAKVVRRQWDPMQSLEEAVASNNVITTYYLDEETVGRVDFARSPQGLFKVSYREVLSPFDDLVAAHFAQHPKALCEVVTPATSIPDGNRVVRSVVFSPPGALDAQFEIHLDEAGRDSRVISIGLDGKPLQEEHLVYDEYGNLTSRIIYDAEGKMIASFSEAEEYERDWI